MSSLKRINGIRELTNDYDTFILDQWGVLHFGSTAPDYVVETLKYLKACRKTIVVLSNSSKSAAFTSARMEKLNIAPELYDHLVTSGEMVRRGLQSRNGQIFENLGRNCFLISSNKDKTTIEDLDYDVVDNVSNADFILLTNCDYKDRPLESYDDILTQGIQHSLPMICANPDTIVVEGEKTFYGPGRIAKRYADLGGRVHYIGKPYAPVYEYVFSLVPNADKARTIMIGDTMEHDIKGGAGVGLATCLTMTGAHGGDFKDTEPQMAVLALEKQFGVMPTYIIDKFEW